MYVLDAFQFGYELSKVVGIDDTLEKVSANARGSAVKLGSKVLEKLLDKDSL